MNDIIERPRAKRKATAPRGVVAMTDFLRGRDLAVAMLESADAAKACDPDACSPLREYRDGKAQHRFTEPFLLMLLADPTMLAGFNAVLSARLADQCESPADWYAVDAAEYEVARL